MSVPSPPIHQQTAFLFVGRSAHNGTVLLYPDRLIHVASAAMQLGILGGALGAVIAQQAASRRAASRAAQGGKGIFELPLANITGFNKAKQGLNRNLLEIHTADGSSLKLGVKYDTWGPELARLLPHLLSQPPVPAV